MATTTEDLRARQRSWHLKLTPLIPTMRFDATETRAWYNRRGLTAEVSRDQSAMNTATTERRL
ncbi:hypothetical protein Bca52824_035243 [Brassica carinata]|uniref:Uncharacterized protein n=1 Tax=Brassica carinata TaxID=52824 RepID=A0A8X7V2I8_BRACI|nr:hypothetical protein Bca52824_035243 [Brassica carinata]